MVGGEIRTCVGLHAQFPELGILDDPRNDDRRMRFIVVLQDSAGELRRVRCISWSQPLEKWRDMPKDDSATISKSWDVMLSYTIDEGDPEKTKGMLGLNR